MKFVAILKTVGDLNKRPKNLKHVPEWFPLETSNAFEAESFKEAQMMYSGKDVMTFDDYIKFQKENAKIDTKVKPKKWWQVFG